MIKKYPKVRSRNGLFTYRYDVTDPTTGKRVQKETISYPTAKKAYDAGLIIEHKLRTGGYIDETNLTISEWADKWIEIYKVSGRVKPRTVDIRRESLQRIKNKIGGIKLRDLSTLQYQTMLNDLKDQGYSYSTISLAHVAVQLMYKTALQLEVIEADPTERAEMPVFEITVQELENGGELPKYLEKEELGLFLRTAMGEGDVQRFHALFTLSYTGLRIGELCALKTSDIDYVNKKISITKTLYHPEGIEKYILGTPKTKSSIRKVDIGDSVIKILKKQEAWRNEFKMSRRHEYYEKEEFVFVNDRKLPGMPISPIRLAEYMKKIIREANLPETITPHSLRHTYTSLMAEAGVELPAIQKLLGHKKNQITEVVYLHVTKSKRREAVDKLDALMDGLI